jgi:hypothetical protein
MFHGIDNIPWSNYGSFPHSVPHNLVMDLNNVMLEKIQQNRAKYVIQYLSQYLTKSLPYIQKSLIHDKTTSHNNKSD